MSRSPRKGRSEGRDGAGGAVLGGSRGGMERLPFSSADVTVTAEESVTCDTISQPTPRIKMHRSFDIPEILDLIFAHLQNRHPDLYYFGPESRNRLNESLGRRDFAALARTCKSFQGPALDFLWREQETLTNLLKCVPSHLWKEEPRNPWRHWSQRPSRFLRIIGPIQPADWDIPLAYAHRIRRLELKSQMESEFSVADVFKIISSGLPREHLCPNLKDLVFDVVELPDSLVPYIRLFVSPEILNTTIYLSSHRPLLPGLPIQYSQLKSLYVSTRYWEDEPLYLDILSTIALKLYRIENLTLHKLDRAAILHLARLPALKSLFLRDLRDVGPFSHFHSQSNSQSGSPLFPDLRDLFLHATTIEFAIEFLHLLSDCRLVDFHVGIPLPATKSSTRRLYVALASHLSHSALQTLRVELPADCEIPAPPADNANYVIDGHILATLFCFPNLTELSLAPSVGFDIDDATAWDIARAWPNLKSLHLTATTGLHHSTRMSLHGLRAFAKHCPELTYLHITFNGAIAPPFEDSPQISQTSLTSLEVGTSPITDPPAVAQFMCGLFPNLKSIDSLEDEESDMDNWLEDDDSPFSRWKQVEAMLPNSKSTSAELDMDAS